jgi:hypothetical protein
MSVNPFGRSTAMSCVAAFVAVVECASVALASRAEADDGVDIWLGGSQCGLGAPESCVASQATFTLPANANAVQVFFTPNPNPCPNLTVLVHDPDTSDGVGLGLVVPKTPGPHTFDVLPTCTQDLTSWGGDLRIDFVKQTGKPVSPNFPVPANGHTVTGDVDVYDEPGGNGKIIGHLKQGDGITLNGPCPMVTQDANNGWCEVTDTTLHLTGAVWGRYISD